VRRLYPRNICYTIINHNPFVISSVTCLPGSSLSVHKDRDPAVKALDKLRKAHPGMQFTIVNMSGFSRYDIGDRADAFEPSDSLYYDYPYPLRCDLVS
jgi:hypothetical protein